jgi:hypothetical protein
MKTWFSIRQETRDEDRVRMHLPRAFECIDDFVVLGKLLVFAAGS